MYPLKFEKVLKTKLWGGRQFETELGVALPTDENYGESWELCSRISGVSRVENGELAGKTLEEIYQQYKEELVGEEVYEMFPNKFPLLVKYLDLQDKLSIRVHPSDDYALKVEKDHGKAKGWYVIKASDDAKMLLGMVQGVNRQEFLDKARQENFDSLFNVVPVRAGDFIYLQPGTVYATYEGNMLVCEIQQNSEMKYRIFDYHRQRDGHPKEIHLEKAAEIIEYDRKSIVSTPKTRETITLGKAKIQELVRDKYFNVDHMLIDGVLMAEKYKNFKVLSILGGQADLVTETGTYKMKKGDTYFIPAKVRVEVIGRVELLKSFL